MLYPRPKPFNEILNYLSGDRAVFVLGCSGCAEAAQAGGRPQVMEMKSRLSEAGKEVTGHAVVDFLCQKALVKSRLRAKEPDIAKADSVLVMSCGIGVQSVASSVSKVCHPGCDTVYLGESRGEWMGQERCQECGECLLEYTGGICPLTSCTKGLLNGPCGGARDGKCEVDRERDCGWEKIYLRLKKLGRLDLLKQFIAPKDYSKMVAAGRLEKSPIWSVEYTFKEGR